MREVGRGGISSGGWSTQNKDKFNAKNRENSRKQESWKDTRQMNESWVTASVTAGRHLIKVITPLRGCQAPPAAWRLTPPFFSFSIFFSFFSFLLKSCEQSCPARYTEEAKLTKSKWQQHSWNKTRRQQPAEKKLRFPQCSRRWRVSRVAYKGGRFNKKLINETREDVTTFHFLSHVTIGK